MNVQSQDIPDMLSDYSNFRQYIEGQLAGQVGHGKGTPWQDFSYEIINNSSLGETFTNLRHNPKKTHDAGWDIVGKTEDESKVLYIQAKFDCNSVASLDGVISSWIELAGVSAIQIPLMKDFLVDEPNISFALVTLADVGTIKKKYLNSQKIGADYLRRWMEEDRVHFIDGPKIWAMIRDAYRRSFAEPHPQTLEFNGGYIAFDGIYLGVVSAEQIRDIYRQTGDSIFFENVRDFLGTTDVNSEIADTILKAPNRFLGRNNGIVFSASEVLEESKNQLRLMRASIINGCQTTMALAKAADLKECYLQVKVVITGTDDESWQVTQAANFQNEVKRIDLDLARFVRPQVVRKLSYYSEFPLSSDDILGALKTFNHTEVTWRNIRILFIGLFSREPGNMFDVRWDLVEDTLLLYYFQDEDKQRRVFSTIFALHQATEEGSKVVADILKENEDEESLDLFSRLLGDTRAPYKQFMGILAACALVDTNVAERIDEVASEVKRMDKLLLDISAVLQNEPQRFNQAYYFAFEKSVGDVLDAADTDDQDVIRRKMFGRITSKARFSNLFRQVKIALHGKNRFQ